MAESICDPTAFHYGAGAAATFRQVGGRHFMRREPFPQTSNPTRDVPRKSRLAHMAIDRAALLAGSIRLASGISFLVDPLRANRLWGDSREPTPSGQLLLHSMGYRDALIGGLLAAAALRGKDTRGWFLASGGADAADLLGGSRVHHDLTRGQQIIGLGGAVIGIGVGLWGATRRPPVRTPGGERCATLVSTQRSQ